ncbi:hypothetical protein L6R50_23755 [Myxococcota bacterium]|nr:hypothetical protein [Myxococcota bacterium]
MSAETRRLNFHMQRIPWTGDCSAVEGLRKGVMSGVEDAFALAGACPFSLLFFGDGFHENMVLKSAIDPGEEAMLAAAIHQFASRPEVRRAFRIGEVLVSDGDGRLTRALAAVERVAPEGDGPVGWWAAWRRVGTGEANVGVFREDWHQATGAGWDSMPEGLGEWLDPGTASIEKMGQEVTGPGPQPEIRMGMMSVNGELPEHPCEVAQVLGNLFDAELLQRKPGGWWVYAARPGTLERYEVSGPLPCPLDDLLRSIAAQGPVDAMAVTHPAVVNTPEGSHRGYVTVVERRGRKGLRIRPMVPAGQDFEWKDPVFQDHGPVGEAGLWIGVPPPPEVNLSVLGPVGSGGAVVPEG